MKGYLNALMCMLCFTTAAACADENQTRDDEVISGKRLPTVENFSPAEEDLMPKTFLETPDILPYYYKAIVRTITDIDVNGSWIRLGDGSLWYVYYFFGRLEVRNEWKVGDHVVLSYANRFFFGTPIAIHNISQGLSVFGLLYFAPKPLDPQTVTITAIHSESASVETSANTTILFGVNTYAWNEFSIGDYLTLMPPQEGTLDGSIVHVWYHRLGYIYSAKHHNHNH